MEEQKAWDPMNAGAVKETSFVSLAFFGFLFIHLQSFEMWTP
jgi:hypothetical protein